MEDTQKSATLSPAPAIEVRGVDFSYGKSRAIRDVTMDIARNQVTSLMARDFP